MASAGPPTFTGSGLLLACSSTSRSMVKVTRSLKLKRLIVLGRLPSGGGPDARIWLTLGTYGTYAGACMMWLSGDHECAQGRAATGR